MTDLDAMRINALAREAGAAIGRAYPQKNRPAHVGPMIGYAGEAYESEETTLRGLCLYVVELTYLDAGGQEITCDAEVRAMTRRHSADGRLVVTFRPWDDHGPTGEDDFEVERDSLVSLVVY